MKMMHPLLRTYRSLFREYGPQGWWPLLEYSGVNPTKTGSLTGYHPKDYTLPKTRVVSILID